MKLSLKVLYEIVQNCICYQNCKIWKKFLDMYGLSKLNQEHANNLNKSVMSN